MTATTREPDTTTQCRECEQPFKLNADGRVPAHETPFGRVGDPHPPCPGGGRPALVRKDYVVRGVIHVEVRIRGAKDADEAAYMVDYAEGALDIEYCGIEIAEVVSADKAEDWNAPDERTMCSRPRCGHLVAGHTGLWSPKETDEDGKETRVKIQPEQCDHYGCGCLSPLMPDADDVSDREAVSS
jgi:hypothetical protein